MPQPWRTLQCGSAGCRLSDPEHEAVIETAYPEAEKLEYKTLKEGFRVLLEEMNKGVRVLCGLPAFYLSEGLMGIFDVVERRDTEPSIFGPYHYVVKEIKLAKNIQKTPHLSGGLLQLYTRENSGVHVPCVLCNQQGLRGI
ncbi:hypothetical protein HKBW3S42_01209 [Candidatus Hakubella thermalkaliphila]|uniref:Uncharacterized protein n=1 Tax=Candidatus Hakubella thermalkaliphila TaxID=2754717 RepID=A0A6V8PJR5_9ACTN|nr:hypothetical protein HKBW3S42_01209 [Candidatus Hakubella thermalkaliphila]